MYTNVKVSQSVGAHQLLLHYFVPQLHIIPHQHHLWKRRKIQLQSVQFVVRKKLEEKRSTSVWGVMLDCVFPFVSVTAIN
jgi:hypothetical protein